MESAAEHLHFLGRMGRCNKVWPSETMPGVGGAVQVSGPSLSSQNCKCHTHTQEMRTLLQFMGGVSIVTTEV